jgi:hypothetical protein
MKLISGILKFFAILLMAFVVIALPLALLLRNVSRVMFSPETIVQLLEENVLDADVLASVAQQSVEEADPLGGRNEENPYAELLQVGFRDLSHDDWVRIFMLISPPELLSQTLKQILKGYYDWIDGTKSVPQIQLDVRPWKRNIINNAVPVVEIVLSKLPHCSPDEIEIYNMSRDTGDYSDIPNCRPPEPHYSVILDGAATYVPPEVSKFPDELDVGKPTLENNRNLDEVRRSLKRMQIGMSTGWIIVLIVFLIAIPMGIRSISDLFKWAGWPLVLAGAWALVISLVLLFFSEGILSGMGGLIFQDAPRIILAPVEAVVSAILIFLSRPLLFQAAVMIVLGGGALVVGVLLSGRERRERVTPKPATTVVSQPYQASSETVQKPQPQQATSKTEPTPEEEQEDEDDDSRPTGMFG